MRIVELPIEDIVRAHPAVYLEHCAVMAVAVMGRQSALLCDFAVACEGISSPAIGGDPRFVLRVSWGVETARKAARVLLAEQTGPIVERASVALAALLFGRLFPDGEMRVTRHGERADYWLPRLRCALEVSGTQDTNALPRRCREKAEQVLANPLGWNGYVVVCCFAEEERTIRWAYHEQEARADAPI